jgi:GDSL-like lipase/acylhydrolase family protein
MSLAGHVVLLGDSIFDNAFYVPGGPSVIEHLKQALPAGWQGTLLAVDGAHADGVHRQLEVLPPDATHLIVSAGGNNALGAGGLIIHGTAQSFAGVLSQLAALQGEFAREYKAMLRAVTQHGKPTAVCTIYDSIPVLEPAERAGLCLFNDVILREAFAAGLPVIDLRLICREATDYAASSPVEPSVTGGGKIARAIAEVVARARFGGWVSEVFSQP